MKAVKWTMAIIALLLVAFVLIVVVVLNSLNGLVETIIEEVGSDVAGTEVQLDSAAIELKRGSAALYGFTVANPQGFSENNVFDVGEMAIDIDPLSLNKEVVVIESVVLSEIKLLAEQKEVTKTNIEALLNNIKRNTASEPDNSSGKDSAESSSEPVYLAVERFVFEKSDLQIVTEEWGETTVPLPEIVLTDLGSAQRGLTPKQLAQQVTEPLLTQIKRHVARELEGMAKDRAREKAEEALQKKLDDKLGDKFGDKGKEAVNQLKGLFK